MQVLDANSGRMYYFNTASGETSWYPPASANLLADPARCFVYPQQPAASLYHQQQQHHYQLQQTQNHMTLHQQMPMQQFSPVTEHNEVEDDDEDGFDNGDPSEDEEVHLCSMNSMPTIPHIPQHARQFQEQQYQELATESSVDTHDEHMLSRTPHGCLDTRLDAQQETIGQPDGNCGGSARTEEDGHSEELDLEDEFSEADEDSFFFDGKDVRCWGRPERLRNFEHVSIPEPGPHHTRFRSLSSIDQQSLEQLAAYGLRRRRGSRAVLDTDALCVTDSANPSSTLNGNRRRGSSFAIARGSERRAGNFRQRSRSFDSGDDESALYNPDATEDLHCVSAVIHAHIVQFVLASSTFIHPRYAIFEEVPGASAAADAAAHNQDDSATDVSANGAASPYTERVRRRRKRSSVGMAIPTREAIFSFLKDVYVKAQMEKECILMSFVYLERLLKATRGQLSLNESNWKGVVLSTMILASKVWDDLSMWNGDFAKICPAFPIKRINQLEVCLLEAMEYQVRVSMSQYAKYFFQLRSMRKVLGIPIVQTQDDALSQQVRRCQNRRNTVFHVR